MCGIRNWRRYLERNWPEMLIQAGVLGFLGLAIMLFLTAVEMWVSR